MRRFVIFILSVLMFLPVVAQNRRTSTGGAAEDSLLYVEAPQVDELLDGADVFSLIAQNGRGSVSISQPSSLKRAMSSHISSNSDRKVNSYRVRIYFDNSQDARNRSLTIARQFSSMYPDVPVYRNHVAPYFKVTVGNFRTRDEAQQFAGRLGGQFSSVFLVKESAHYPSL